MSVLKGFYGMANKRASLNKWSENNGFEELHPCAQFQRIRSNYSWHITHTYTKWLPSDMKEVRSL